MPRPYKNFFEGKSNRQIKSVKFSRRRLNRMKLVIRDGGDVRIAD